MVAIAGIMLAIVGTGLITLVFAKSNKTEHSTIGVELVENFERSSLQNLTPGRILPKEIGAVQTKDENAIVRIRIEEFMRLYRSENGDLVIHDLESPAPNSENNEEYEPASVPKDAVVEKLMQADFMQPGQSIDTVPTADISRLKNPVQGLRVFVKKIADADYTSYQFVAYNELINGNWQMVVPSVEIVNEKPVATKVLYQFYSKIEGKEEVFTSFKDQRERPVQFNINETAVKPIEEWASGVRNVWYYDSDGWMYYGNVLSDGESTSLIADTLSVQNNFGTSLSGMEYYLNIRLQGVVPEVDRMKLEWNSGADFPELETPQWQLVKNNSMSEKAVELMTGIIQEYKTEKAQSTDS